MFESLKEKNTIKNMPITSIDLDIINNRILNCDYCFRGKKMNED